MDYVTSDNEMYPKVAIGLAIFESFSSHETCHVSGIEFQLGIFYKEKNFRCTRCEGLWETSFSHSYSQL
jgi:hypothetical protein